VAVSRDGGKTWKLAAPTPFPGAAFGVSYVNAVGDGEGHDRDRDNERDHDRDSDGDHGRGHERGQSTVVATGPGGAAWSPDEGTTWAPISGVEGYWSVAFASPRTGWLVGTGGRILKISF